MQMQPISSFEHEIILTLLHVISKYGADERT